MADLFCCLFLPVVFCFVFISNSLFVNQSAQVEMVEVLDVGRGRASSPKGEDSRTGWAAISCLEEGRGGERKAASESNLARHMTFSEVGYYWQVSFLVDWFVKWCACKTTRVSSVFFLPLPLALPPIPLPCHRKRVLLFHSKPHFYSSFWNSASKISKSQIWISVISLSDL